MSRLVSVEAGLEDIKMHLEQCGYQVFDMAENMRPVEVVVYKSLTPCSQQSQKTALGTLMINACGLQGEDVVACLSEQ